MIATYLDNDEALDDHIAGTATIPGTSRISDAGAAASRSA